MQGKNCGAPLARLLFAAVLIGAPAGRGERARSLRRAHPRAGARSALGPRAARASPRASAFDLKELQRRLHDRRIDGPRDPRLEELALELRRLRAKADREARAPPAAALPRSSLLSSPAPIEKPRYLGGAHTRPAAPPARPYFGQRVLALQRSVAELERRLAQGDTTAASRLLEAVETDLAMAGAKTTLELVIAGLDVEVWPPNGGPGPYPLVLFSHGLGRCKTQSTYLMRPLAQHGMLVVAPDHKDKGDHCPERPPTLAEIEMNLPGPHDDRMDDLQKLREALQAKPAPLPWPIDPDRVALIGHSLGDSRTGARRSLAEPGDGRNCRGRGVGALRRTSPHRWRSG
jgi:hypothetical protein